VSNVELRKPKHISTSDTYPFYLKDNVKTKHFPANTAGRDFVVGDLHGCILLLEDTLDYLNFDETKDRLFSVGDLGDRGPDSPACMELMFQPWFHAVRSNHGDLMSAWVDGEPMGVYNWMPNGGQWATEIDPALLEKYAEADKALPYLITVEGPRKFHVIHAEFSTREPLTDEMLAIKDVDFIRKVDKAGFENSGDGPLITWGRVIYRQFFNRDIPKDFIYPEQHLNFFNPDLSHIYSGHTVMKMPTRYLGQTNLDTGAVFSAKEPSLGLTVTEPATDSFWKTNSQGTFEVNVAIV
jgi:serine/threonine protein phosphatase 1